ncbi:putative microtubule-associated protein [Cyclospora cayetanensis]|uniref:Microtubule-associated protein n=1 Tax=Cyclospora cayetanensis TaxID=88456 RepID=A0A1D3D4R7_9EIME|nr:putative microtubule-associated protein [Cyclospora cayetanensis]
MALRGPPTGLKAVLKPSWLEDEHASEEASAATLQQHAAKESGEIGSVGGARAYVFFTTDLPEPLRLPQEPLSIEASLRRVCLCCAAAPPSALWVDLQLVNRLLTEKDPDAWPIPQPLDFLVDGKTFLRGSLKEHMQQHAMTAEVAVRLHYQLAMRKGEEHVLPPAPDWISEVAVPSSKGAWRVFSQGCRGGGELRVLCSRALGAVF